MGNLSKYRKVFRNRKRKESYGSPENATFHNFRRVRKITKSEYKLRHVCSSARKEQLDFHWKEFHGI